MDTNERSSRSEEASDGLVALAAVALLAGAAAGCLAALFRLTLIHADAFRERLLAWAGPLGTPGWLAVIAAAAAATALAAALVRRCAPLAGGSGIPHVEAVVRNELPPAPLALIVVKFVGGVLASGSGLALGREGPSVQMGASAAHRIGLLFRRNSADCLALLAAGAGAGLATAFNAPFAGAIFVLEELLRRFDARSTIATLAASAGAIAVARLMLGHAAVFTIEPLPHSEVQQLPLFLLLGLLGALLGVAYNKAIVGALLAARALPRVPVELRAGAIGALVAAVACFAPALVGGGDALTQGALAGAGTLGFLALVFAVRFVLGSLSYAAETPGGLFAPLLALGAVGGLAFGHLCAAVLPDLAPHPTAFAAVGMAAFFTATIRAPVTGIILTIEMTGLSTQFLPMLSASAVAMLVPQLLRAEPIYDTLRRMAVAAKRAESDGS